MSCKVIHTDGTAGHLTHEIPEGREYLVAWISMELDREPQIKIYGNPTGLRALASKLIEMADVDQSMVNMPDSESDHCHYRTGCNTESEGSVPGLIIGRVDTKLDPQILRSCFPARVPEFGGDQAIL